MKRTSLVKRYLVEFRTREKGSHWERSTHPVFTRRGKAHGAMRLSKSLLPNVRWRVREVKCFPLPMAIASRQPLAHDGLAIPA